MIIVKGSRSCKSCLRCRADIKSTLSVLLTLTAGSVLRAYRYSLNIKYRLFYHYLYLSTTSIGFFRSVYCLFKLYSSSSCNSGKPPIRKINLHTVYIGALIAYKALNIVYLLV